MGQLFILTVTVSLFGVLSEVNCSSSSMKRVTRAQILGFEWKNCGQPDDPAVLQTLTVYPDPISIPGTVTASASGSTSVELSSPLSQHVEGRRDIITCCLMEFLEESGDELIKVYQLNVTLEKDVAGFWVKVPCLDELGSCHYQDACDVLNQLIPAGQDCPEPLPTYGLPCHCPFKVGSYSLPQSDFYVPNVDLPQWLTNGKYRVQSVLGGQGKELGCIAVVLSLHSD